MDTVFIKGKSGGKSGMARKTIHAQTSLYILNLFSTTRVNVQ